MSHFLRRPLQSSCPRLIHLGGMALFALATVSNTRGDDDPIEFFENSVRPLLTERCIQCHGPNKQKGGMRLDSIQGLLDGGDNGPAIVPGKPDESHLIEAVNYASWEMPPDGKLADDEIVALTRWVEMGAPWPGAKVVSSASGSHGKQITDADRAHWAYRPLTKPAVPEVKSQKAGIRTQNAIDAFILDRLNREGLLPAPQADRATLIRRSTFDLIGLPPTLEEIEAFVNDSSPHAFDRMLDRLLSSPHYGERWGRHWLDLVRFAESDGYRQDAFRENAWRYRDYVIRAFNNDKSYDEFVREQLAGDELDPQNPDALIATGFLRNGIYEHNQVDIRRQRSEILNEVTDVTADVFLGMGMGCARCHNHKFDPILQRDYFRLQAFFAPLVWRDGIVVATSEEKSQHETKLAEWERATADVRRQIDEIDAGLGPLSPNDRIGRFPEDIKAILRSTPEDRSPTDEQLYRLAVRQVMPFVRDQPNNKEIKDRYDQLQKQLAAFQELKPPPLPVALGAGDVGPEAPPTIIPGARQQTPLEPGIPEVLGHLSSPDGATWKPNEKHPPGSTGRRTALARWIASPQNPLTARVIVNRVWQHHFGRGLAVNTSDFGRLGEPPTHPELLDWLTTEFIEHEWSIKHLHRLIMVSATYQQLSQSTSDLATVKDPQNTLLWRQNYRRLSAEQVRDAALAVSGALDRKMFGPSVPSTKPRRTIYTMLSRNTRDPLLEVFDAPDGYLSVPQRNSTTTPIQALLMINGDWMLGCAQALADRVRKTEVSSDESQAEQVYKFVFGRSPTQRERLLTRSFFRNPPALADAKTANLPTNLVRTMPQRGGNAAVIDPELPRTVLCTEDLGSLPTGDFTIEAFVLLQSIYDDSSVRTIAAQWDGGPSAGWAIGVTGELSTYKPRNLILQITGDATSASQHVLVASDIQLKLNCPYYVAAVVRGANPNESSVTFHVKDLSDNDAPLVSKHVAANLPTSHESPWALTIGGRDSNPAHSWDGLIDEVRLSHGPLTPEQLMWPDGAASETCVGFWKFEETPGFDKDSSGKGKHLISELSPTTLTDDTLQRAVLIDFCHVLLNSSEFLYID